MPSSTFDPQLLPTKVKIKWIFPYYSNWYWGHNLCKLISAVSAHMSWMITMFCAKIQTLDKNNWYRFQADLLYWWDQIDDLVQESHNSIANALELRLSCINPSRWGLEFLKKSMSKSMITEKLFHTWLLIDWRHSSPVIRSHIRISLLANVEFNMEFSLSNLGSQAIWVTDEICWRHWGLKLAARHWSHVFCYSHPIHHFVDNHWLPGTPVTNMDYL